MTTGNPRFDTIITTMVETHKKKSQDYANTANYYQNFEEVAATVGIPVETVFRVLIALKLARLKELLGSGKSPANESVQDSKLDLAVYSALYASYELDRPQPAPAEDNEVVWKKPSTEKWEQIKRELEKSQGIAKKGGSDLLPRPGMIPYIPQPSAGYGCDACNWGRNPCFCVRPTQAVELKQASTADVQCSCGGMIHNCNCGLYR